MIAEDACHTIEDNKARLKVQTFDNIVSSIIASVICYDGKYTIKHDLSSTYRQYPDVENVTYGVTRESIFAKLKELGYKVEILESTETVVSHEYVPYKFLGITLWSNYTAIPKQHKMITYTISACCKLD